MDLGRELTIMQQNYIRNPLPYLTLFRPDWLQDNDQLTLIYKHKDALLKKGTITLARVVQANSFLFHFSPKIDCPANIIYSASPAAKQNPLFLLPLSSTLFSYKNKPLEDVPEKWRDIARVITDEYDRSSFSFEAETGAGPAEVHFIPTIIYRKLLPFGKLCGGFLPVLTIPETSTVLILPKKYWSRRFKIAWCLGRV